MKVRFQVMCVYFQRLFKVQFVVRYKRKKHIKGFTQLPLSFTEYFLKICKHPSWTPAKLTNTTVHDIKQEEETLLWGCGGVRRLCQDYRATIILKTSRGTLPSLLLREIKSCAEFFYVGRRTRQPRHKACLCPRESCPIMPVGEHYHRDTELHPTVVAERRRHCGGAMDMPFLGTVT